MMYGNGKDNQSEGIVRKAYVIIEGKKFYIDPEIVKKRAFCRYDSSGLTFRHIYIEEEKD